MMNDILEMLIRRSRGASPVPPTPTIPTDYVFYAPLVDYNADTDETGRTLTHPGGYQNLTVDGIQCVSFNGTGIYTDDYTGLPTGKSPWTQSVWAYILSWGDNAFFSFGATTGVSYESIHLQKRSTSGHINGGGWYLDYTFDQTFQENTWYHLCQTYDGTTFRGYVNGVLTNTVVNGDVNVGSGRVGIGRQPNDYESLSNTYLASARIYDRVLSDDEIQALASEFGGDQSESESESESSGSDESSSSFEPAIPTDYVFYAPLKTDTTPIVGTFVEKNAIWSFSTAPDGTPAAYNASVEAYSYQMAGLNYTGNISSTDSVSCSIWCYCTREFNIQPPDWLCPVAVGNKNGSGIAFEWGYKGNFEIPWMSGWDSNDYTLRPTNNAWHHVLFTYEQGGYMNIYVDGSLIWTSTTTKSIAIGSNNLYVGTRFNDGRPWVGYLRNAIIYNRVLTSSEISAIYNVGIDQWQ